MQRILIIHPLKYWQMNGANVHLAATEDELLTVRGRLTKDDLAEDDHKTSYLLKACDSLTENSLYEDIGKKKYRKQEAFWSEADESIKNYTLRIAGQRLLDTIRRAEELGISIYFRNKATDEISVAGSVSLQPTEVRPVMSFQKDADSIHYRLMLAIGAERIIPAQSDIQILAINPGLIRIQDSLYLLPQDFNAKIITPFISKENIVIPLRMQNEYFRKFILKNASKAEVIAEGFDIEEKDVERKCIISLERSFNGKASVTLYYRYGSFIYNNENHRKATVSIVEEGEQIKLVKVSRDALWEEDCRATLHAISTLNFDKGYSLFPNMKEAVGWLSGIRDMLNKDDRFIIQQHTSSSFYIGSHTVQKSKTWAGDWLNIRIAVVLADGLTLPFAYFREAITTGQQEIALPNGDIFIIPDEWFATYGGLMMVASINGNYFRIHRSQLSALEKDTLDSAADESHIITKGQSIDIPNTLQASLRSYQEEGFRWLSGNYDARTGCCLSDDMGLGKTIQTIALILRNKELVRIREEERLHNLQQQEKKNTAGRKKKKADAYGMTDMFAGFFNQNTAANTTDEPSCKTTLIVCPSSILFNWSNELHRFAPQLQVCAYVGSVAERKKKLEHLALWDVVLTTYRTATNDIEDLGMLRFDMIVFDESQVFKNRNSQVYSAMLRLKGDYHMALSGTPMENSLPELWSLMNILNPLLLGDYKTFQKYFISPISENLEDLRTQILRKTIAPYFLRRTKQQVLTDLPDRQDEVILCEMSEEQRHIYDEELSKARNLTTDASSNELVMLSAIGRLRQIACTPMLLKDSISTDQGKLTAIFAHLDQLKGSDHKVLLFSEYVSFLTLIAEEMKQRNWSYDILTGETRNREQVIKHFSSSADTQFFLVSLKAGGVGLNITRADYVFLLDPWWNKAAEEQAISRAHRMGQKRSVFVYRFITKDTLEEQILQLQDYKSSLIQAVMPFLKK